MPRQELHTDKIKIEQKPPIIGDLADRDEEIIQADPSVMTKTDWLDELKFNEEPVMIRIEPSTERNAALAYPVWNNGKGGEILIGGKWLEATYFPVGRQFITKRKYVATMLGSKIDVVETVHDDATVATPRNDIRRTTTPTHSFSIIEDKNPRGAAWFSELRRRNF